MRGKPDAVAVSNWGLVFWTSTKPRGHEVKSHSSEFRADHFPQCVINLQEMLLQIISEISVVQGSG